MARRIHDQFGDQVIDRVIGPVNVANLHFRYALGCAGAGSFCNESLPCLFGTNNTIHLTKHVCKGFTALLLRVMHIDPSESAR